jgi:hypothetical protein
MKKRIHRRKPNARTIMKWLQIGLLLSWVIVLAACGGGGGSTRDGNTPPPVVVLPDTTPPAAPAGLVATPRSASQIDLAWNAAPTEEGVTAYQLFRNGNLVATVIGNVYSDTGLFAESPFSYAVAAVDEAGNVSPQSALVSTQTLPFAVSDTAVGDPAVSYANVEFTADGRYMVWFEQATDGSALGAVWHCEIDPTTGALNPPDGKGFSAFDSSAWGRANPGRDAAGVYYVGMDRSGNLILVRPTGADSGDRTLLPTPVDVTRRSIYPTDLPEANGGDVFWIKNSSVAGSGLDPGNTWFELQYIDLSDPVTVKVIERQDKPPVGFAPMDIGFARWFRGKATLIYGFFGAAQCGPLQNRPCVQVRAFDATAATPASVDVTSDAVSKIDPFPFSFQGDDLLLAGIDGTATSHVYRRGSGTSQFSAVESIYPTGSSLTDPALAQSHERIVFDDALYTAYQVNDKGSGFFGTAFANTGEIWLSTVLQSSQRQWRLSEATDAAKAEPEPYVGASKVWVFYSALPKGAEPDSAVWSLRRAETPIGKR